TTDDRETIQHLYDTAHATAQQYYGNKIFMRGLIEISNHCKNDCLYCGIRRSQPDVRRYRLTKEEILDCCEQGYALGFRTYVLQGGEDGWFDDDRMCDIVAAIRQQYTDCAITLSLGERSRESYQRLYDAGANRYLLRHETADPAHYARLHPTEMSFDNRMRCLQDLRDIGYQVGCGFMVGSPYQTIDTLYKDLQFIRQFKPQMVGIGPFIPASGTPFADRPAGSVETTLRLLSLIRLLHPPVLLPATTALGTLHPRGRELGIMAGANVVMPNLSPREHRKDYNLYDNKLCTGDEAAECRVCLDRRIRTTGSQLVVDRGDAIKE
ncbi:MAG: [FeFe] hydrogenase H-cluster radical SAM maturase HydE, partial [Bacteroidales bacterium]|nr:[FeFe] hydrogenase H-cluster radical SAM maturase HydE [Bacteroidales bacterium]